MGEQSKKLGVMMLAALVVSAMVGGGIFSLPQNMSQGAGAGAVLIAWIITGVGIFFLANTFRILADARPDATTGIYAYARLGFGRFAGFPMLMSGEVFGGADCPQIKYLKQLETWDAEFSGFEHVNEGAETIDGVYHVMCVKESN